MIHWVKPSKVELYSFIISMPFIDLALNAILYGNRVYTDVRIWLISFPLIYSIGMVSWYAQVSYNSFVEKKIPFACGKQQTDNCKGACIYFNDVAFGTHYLFCVRQIAYPGLFDEGK
ncbi:MAG: hypothetical protein WDO19_20630 [Bacteroidota bacterium]